MNQPGLTFTFTFTFTLTALHLLTWRAWAVPEVSMEDKKEVLMGTEVDMACLFNLEKTATNLTIEWFVGSPSGTKKRLHYKAGNEEPKVEATSFADRISASYNPNTNGNSILTINRTQINDEQHYYCRVSTDMGSDEKHTGLFVFQPPSAPSIEPGQYVTADSDKLEKIATCTVENAYPTPNIQWHKGRTPLQYSDEDVHVINSVTVHSTLLRTVHSDLQLKRVEKKDKDAEFYCEVSYSAVGGERMMESQRVKIPVHYASTQVNMKQVSPKRAVKEGDRVEIRCQGDGTLIEEITFSRNGDDLKSENGLLVLEDVTRADGGDYVCVLTDWTEFLQSEFALKVHFMDDVVITQESPQLDEGQNLSLTCNALCSLPALTVWYKDNEQLHEGHVLTVSNVSSNTAGTYTCRVKATELPELWKESSVKVTVRGKPVITDGVEVIWLEDGNLLNLSCSAIGHPTPKITWSLADEQSPLHMWNTQTDDNIISIISISAVSTINASCQAENEMGSVMESLTVNLDQFKNPTTDTTGTISSITTEPPAVSHKPPKKTERKESSGFIIAILIILVLLLAILGSVLYFLYKKGRIACGRSGKQDLTKESASKDDFVVEMKSGKSEEAVLLQGVNGDKKIPNDQ